MKKALVNLSEESIFQLMKVAILMNSEGKFSDELLEEVTKAFEERKVWHDFPKEKPEARGDYICVFDDTTCDILYWSEEQDAFVNDEYIPFFEDPVRWTEIPRNL